MVGMRVVAVLVYGGSGVGVGVRVGMRVVVVWV